MFVLYCFCLCFCFCVCLFFFFCLFTLSLQLRFHENLPDFYQVFFVSGNCDNGRATLSCGQPALGLPILNTLSTSSAAGLSTVASLTLGGEVCLSDIFRTQAKTWSWFPKLESVYRLCNKWSRENSFTSGRFTVGLSCNSLFDWFDVCASVGNNFERTRRLTFAPTARACVDWKNQASNSRWFWEIAGCLDAKLKIQLAWSGMGNSVSTCVFPCLV